ncbi:MAG: hypothetical protein Q7T82_02840 [Armatimonadota bacterium]|nr:hypothetical protein [Armatimonadota bacterium]
MNALPVGCNRLKDEQYRAQYFEDLDRWGFDVAYAAYYAQPPKEVFDECRQAYTSFAQDAHKRGLPACVQIQTTVAHPEAVDIDEAQYHLDNAPDMFVDGSFFASFASEKWKAFLKELTRVFVEDYGYDWVVFEEPMYRVDIPGHKDRFYALFKEEYPNVDYPLERDETEGYLKVQKLKADVLVRFYEDLAAHAKSVGATKTGIMPWFFIPTIENTPEGTLNTSCDIGRIAGLDDVDFLVVRMQPDNVYVGTMRTGDDMERSPLLYYPEVLAHATGKPVMAVTNPVDEHTNNPDSWEFRVSAATSELPLIPLEFFQKALLASLAAAPNGMTRHWYGQRYGADSAHMEFMTPVNRFVNRLGNPVSPVAFLFSYRGGRHAAPYTYETAWRSYWAIAKQLMFNEKLPMRTLYADSLAKGLESAPETRVVILDERFPISIAQARILRQWWQAAPGRAVLVFGGGLGFSADEETPGEQPLADAFPQILRTIGVRQHAEPRVELPNGQAKLTHVSRATRTAFLGRQVEVSVDRIANVERIFGSRSAVIYADERTGTPVVIKSNGADGLGIFCGLGLSESTAGIAAQIVKYALHRLGTSPPAIQGVGEGLLWSETRAGYVVVANASDAPTRATLPHGICVMWDVVNGKLLPRDSSSTLDLEPLSFRLFRRVGKRSKLYDIVDAVYVVSVVDGAGRADISAFTRSRISFITKVTPNEAMVDGRNVDFSVTDLGAAYEVTIESLTTGDHLISLRW